MENRIKQPNLLSELEINILMDLIDKAGRSGNITDGNKLNKLVDIQHKLEAMRP